MNSNEESDNLLKRFEQGDEHAARQIFERYAVRLTALARSRLNQELVRHVDPEDIVQSAFRSFFRRAGDGNYSVKAPGDLWRLLATITVNKLRHQRDHHLAEKRSVQREDSAGSNPDGVANGQKVHEVEPTDTDVLALLEELTHILEPLEPRQREIVVLRLESWTIAEIAAEVNRTERTVRRVLARVRTILDQRLGGD